MTQGCLEPGRQLAQDRATLAWPGLAHLTAVQSKGRAGTVSERASPRQRGFTEIFKIRGSIIHHII